MGTKILAAKRVNTDEGEFAGMRHVTRFKTVVEDLAKDKLDMNEYPSVLPMPAGKGSTTSSLRGKSLRPSRHGKDAKGLSICGRWHVLFGSEGGLRNHVLGE